MNRMASIAIGTCFCLVSPVHSNACRAAGLVIDHGNTDLASLSLWAVRQAKAELHIAYGHTSHGSQVTEGMTAMNAFINGGGLGMSCPVDTFKWNDGPSAGALDIDDYFASGDLGNPNYTAWADGTRTYLDNPTNSDVNVILWSWCGQADTTAANIDLYLGLMTQLEIDYPDVRFVYMTGHVNGCATTGNLFLRNQQIRDYCIANGKVLYDFADIESWDPDGNYYGDKLVLDDCSYDSDGNGTRDRNWAIDWQNTHTQNVEWFSCSCSHSQPLNGNQKAYAAWSLWTSLITPVPGDANRDGSVGEEDAKTLATHWGQSGDWEQGDFDNDGLINALDAAILAAHWGDHASREGNGVAVPEPSMLGMLMSLGLLASGRRRQVRNGCSRMDKVGEVMRDRR
ncbi:MAG TPA: hypothetical protein DD670_06985 [Planctomycetaceae bacterium]|nr:hypothetical protein [Planctomycetaceae bacterium]